MVPLQSNRNPKTVTYQKQTSYYTLEQYESNEKYMERGNRIKETLDWVQLTSGK